MSPAMKQMSEWQGRAWGVHLVVKNDLLRQHATITLLVCITASSNVLPPEWCF
jgi:hypothetical protein